MRYQEKTREELVVMLVTLEAAHEELKNLFKKKITESVVSERSMELSRTAPSDRNDNKPSDILIACKSILRSDEKAGNRHLEEKLKESEEKFRNVFEHSIVGNSITTIDGRIQTNKAFCDLLGYSANELNEIKWTEITHPEDIQANFDILNSIMAGEKRSARWEKRYIHKNESHVYVDINTVLLRDEQGAPMHFITSIIDISSRVMAQEKLKENSIRLDLAMKSANMAWWEMNVSTGAVTFNHRKSEMLGYPSENFKHYYDFMALVHPDDSERIMGAMQRHMNGTADKYEAEYRILSQSGEYLWFYDIGSVVKKDLSGEPLQVSGLVFDITRRKKAEEEILRAKGKAEESERYIKSVADNLVNGMIYQSVFLPDGQRKFTYLSDSITSFYGCTAEEAKADANLVYGRMHKDDIERVRKEENAALENMAVFKTELRLIDVKGNIRWASLVSSPRKYKSSIYWDGIEIDITDIKLTEFKLLKTNRLYNVISQINRAIVHTKDKNRLLEDVCRIAVEYGNFRMSWVGLVDEKDQMIRPFTYAGHENGYLSIIRQIPIGDVPEGHGPSGQVFNEGRNFVCNNFENDPSGTLWKDEAVKRKYRSYIGLPIKLFGNVIGVLFLYASVPDFFDEEEIELLSEVATEISYAIEALEIEYKHNLAVSSLSVNEKKYREITESIKDVVWVLDADTMCFIYVSPSVKKLRGYTPEEVMALPISAAIKPEYHESVFNLMETQIVELLKGNISSETYFTVELEQPCKDGSCVFTEVVAYLLVSEKSGKVEVHGLTRDITDRKRAEESLRKSEERFHGIFNNLQDAFFQTDLAGNISLVSPSAIKMFGYSLAEEMLGNPVSTLYANVGVRKNLISKLSADGSVIDFLAEGKKKDGTIFWASLNVQFRYENGKISGTEGVVRDVTERKIQEDKINTLSSAIEQSPVMILITDINGVIEYVNPKFCKVTGYTLEEVTGQNVCILKSTSWSPDNNNKLWDTILTGKVWHGEFENVKKNGEIYYESSSISPITDEHGNIKHFISVKEDITEKKELLRDLIKAKDNAEESDRLKSAFLANMSHEIRTPMNGIMGFIELLKEPNLTGSEQKAYIQVIEESGDRMLNLMNNLIDISRIESGEIKVFISCYDINKQLDNIFNFFVHEASKKGLKLLRRYNLSSGDSMIKTDMQKLDAILINLVKNAIKFTMNGSVSFGCSRQGDNFLFFVKDSGVGIGPGYLEVIFDRFRQASESLSRPYEGAGLGLSISKAFVESLGGKIWVESELDKGSTFYFILPADMNETHGIPVQRAVGSNIIKNLQEELNVLIVEDDETSMNYMEIIAGTFCTKYFKASTGREAVDIFRLNQDINLILMDIKMPVMDGLEATRLIRQLNREVVIIAQTAYSMVGDREKALEAGCNDYISKPVNKDQLRKLIQLHTKYL